MWTIESFETLAIPCAKPSVGMTIGAFDGVHLGHQALIRRMVTESHQWGLEAVVLTFDPLPRQFFDDTAGTQLSSREERLALIEDLGVDGVVMLPFDHALAVTSAEDFLERLARSFHMRGLWIGPDFAMGRDRTGDVAFLRKTGNVMGFQVHVFHDAVMCRGKPVRSSRIRTALKSGEVGTAWDCLGRPYRISGIVQHGDGRGHTLGFPTANVAFSNARLLPRNGVYVCQAHLPQGDFNAVTNVGTRPTFDHSLPQVEAHLLDFSADIYGISIQLDFLHALRRERAFSSVDALVNQMYVDVSDARRWLQSAPPPPHRESENSE